VSALDFWFEDDATMWTFDCEPEATDDATEALTASNGVIWWSAAANVFDLD
jgi:hypothetical protein